MHGPGHSNKPIHMNSWMQTAIQKAASSGDLQPCIETFSFCCSSNPMKSILIYLQSIVSCLTLAFKIRTSKRFFAISPLLSNDELFNDITATTGQSNPVLRLHTL